MRKLLTLALAVTAVIALSPARAQETKERAALSWKLAKGDKARYAYSYELATNQDFVGESKQKVSLHLSQEVTDLAAGTATIQAKIDRIVATFDMGMLGGKMSYDSDKEKNAKGDGDKKKDDKKKDE
ncbi:hypothetical protein HY251_20575, partial [bacterium]|nr:hypothetical protein [bacterium]